MEADAALARALQLEEHEASGSQLMAKLQAAMGKVVQVRVPENAC